MISDTLLRYFVHTWGGVGFPKLDIAIYTYVNKVKLIAFGGGGDEDKSDIFLIMNKYVSWYVVVKTF